MFFFGLVNFNWLEIYWGFFAVKKGEKGEKVQQRRERYGRLYAFFACGGVRNVLGHLDFIFAFIFMFCCKDFKSKRVEKD